MSRHLGVGVCVSHPAEGDACLADEGQYSCHNAASRGDAAMHRICDHQLHGGALLGHVAVHWQSPGHHAAAGREADHEAGSGKGAASSTANSSLAAYKPSGPSSSAAQCPCLMPVTKMDCFKGAGPQCVPCCTRATLPSRWQGTNSHRLRTLSHVHAETRKVCSGKKFACMISDACFRIEM